MALPWPIAGASLSALPKPGPWMVHVKHALGVFILATATYYGYLSYTLFADRWVDAADVTSSVEELVNEGWYASMRQGLQDARDQNTLVLVDMWATWCKNCLTMDKTTLKNPDVQAGLADYVKIKFKAEDPSTSPAKEVMEQFGAIGCAGLRHSPTHAGRANGDGPGSALARDLHAKGGRMDTPAEGRSPFAFFTIHVEADWSVAQDRDLLDAAGRHARRPLHAAGEQTSRLPETCDGGSSLNQYQLQPPVVDASGRRDDGAVPILPRIGQHDDERPQLTGPFFGPNGVVRRRV